MKLYIKNMVCNRCILVVGQVLDNLELNPITITMGEVEFASPLSEAHVQILSRNLLELGFELLDTKGQKQIEKIKNVLIQKVQHGEIEEHFGLSDFLMKALNKEYTQLSRLFSEVEGTTIEQFFILQKIEKVKEWLVYDELTLSEIAWKLGYSSVAHLSSQFKKVTGLTPSHFKTFGGKNRKPLDKI